MKKSDEITQKIAAQETRISELVAARESALDLAADGDGAAAKKLRQLADEIADARDILERLKVKREKALADEAAEAREATLRRIEKEATAAAKAGAENFGALATALRTFADVTDKAAAVRTSLRDALIAAGRDARVDSLVELLDIRAVTSAFGQVAVRELADRADRIVAALSDADLVSYTTEGLREDWEMADTKQQREAEAQRLRDEEDARREYEAHNIIVTPRDLRAEDAAAEAKEAAAGRRAFNPLSVLPASALGGDEIGGAEPFEDEPRAVQPRTTATARRSGAADWSNLPPLEGAAEDAETTKEAAVE